LRVASLLCWVATTIAGRDIVITVENLQMTLCFSKQLPRTALLALRTFLANVEMKRVRSGRPVVVLYLIA